MDDIDPIADAEGNIYIGATVTLPDDTEGVIEDIWYNKNEDYMVQVNGQVYRVDQLQNGR